MNIILIIFLSVLSCSLNQTSSIKQLYKIIITDDINKIKTKELYGYYYNTKGVGLIFDSSYDVSIFPKQIFYNIYRYYHDVYDFIDQIQTIKNGYEQFIIIESLRPFETIHFIFEDMGITIPTKVLFYESEEEEDLIFFFRFLTKEDQENIIIGKDLIELMNVTFLDSNNIVINNKDYISKIDDKY